MSGLEQSEASDLVEVFPSLINDRPHLLLLQTVRAEHLPQGILGEGLKGAPMELIGPWGSLGDDLVTAPGFVVLLLTLFTEHVPNVVAILFLKFV
jgi:hypothetical protein